MACKSGVDKLVFVTADKGIFLFSNMVLIILAAI